MHTCLHSAGCSRSAFAFMPIVLAAANGWLATQSGRII